MPGGPFDYRIQQSDLGQRYATGFAQGAKIREIVAQRKMQELQQEQMEQKRIEMSDLAQSPSVAKTRGLILKYPDLAAQYKGAMDSMSESEQRERVGQATSIYSAIKTDNLDVAQQIADEAALAYENSGRTQDANAMKMMSKMIKDNPKLAAMKSSLLIAASKDADKLVGSFAELDQMGAAKESIEAKTEGVKADTSLTKEKTLTEPVSKNKINAEIMRLKAETKALTDDSGKIPVGDRADQELKYMEKYTKHPDVIDFYKVRSAYDRVESSNPDAAGDIALIFNYMKMLDPGSTVREGEFATAQNAAGVDDKTRNYFNKLMSGERLSAPQRTMFKKQAKSFFDGSSKRESSIRKGIGRIAENYGLNKDNIFIEEDKPQAEAAPATSGLPTEVGQTTEINGIKFKRTL